MPAFSAWRSLAFALAAIVSSAGAAFGQSTPLAERIQQCGACHGEDGNSRMPNVPSLAGQPEFFVMNQLFLMREGVRRIEVMMRLVKDLKDDDLAGLAKHFAALAPKASDEPIDPALVTRGGELASKLRCGSCHLPTLAGQEQMPRLAKQRVDYMIAALKEFRDNKRSGADTLMSAVIVGLPDADLAALAHYAASR
jgi:cytochrome c553